MEQCNYIYFYTDYFNEQYNKRIQLVHTRACLLAMKMGKVTVKVVLSRFPNTGIRIYFNMHVNLLSQGYTKCVPIFQVLGHLTCQEAIKMCGCYRFVMWRLTIGGMID